MPQYLITHVDSETIFNWLNDWCLTQTLVVFQLYSGVNDILQINFIFTKTLRNKT
jgi:hypothetical protein